MRISYFWECLKYYDFHHGNETIFSFFDQHDILRVKEFVASLGTEDRELTPAELLRLSKILLNEHSAPKTLARSELDLFRHELFGTRKEFPWQSESGLFSTYYWIDKKTAAIYLTAFEALYRHHLLDQQTLYAIFATHNPVITARWIINLSQHKGLLSKETLEICLKEQYGTVPVLCMLYDLGLATPRNLQLIPQLEKYTIELRHVLTVMTKHNVSIRDENAILANPQIAPVLDTAFRTLKGALDKSLISFIVQMTAQEAKSIDSDQSYQARIVKMLDVLNFTCERISLAGKEEGPLFQHAPIDMRTPRNLYALLRRAEQFAAVDKSQIAKLKSAYEDAQNQREAQRAFDKFVGQLDRLMPKRKSKSMFAEDKSVLDVAPASPSQLYRPC